MKNFLDTVPCVHFKASAMTNRGIADRIVLYMGIYLAMELKTDTGRPTGLQLDFLERVRQNGGIAGVVRNIADVKELLNEAESIVRNRELQGISCLE